VRARFRCHSNACFENDDVKFLGDGPKPGDFAGGAPPCSPRGNLRFSNILREAKLAFEAPVHKPRLLHVKARGTYFLSGPAEWRAAPQTSARRAFSHAALVGSTAKPRPGAEEAWLSSEAKPFVPERFGAPAYRHPRQRARFGVSRGRRFCCPGQREWNEKLLPHYAVDVRRGREVRLEGYLTLYRAFPLSGPAPRGLEERSLCGLPRLACPTALRQRMFHRRYRHMRVELEVKPRLSSHPLFSVINWLLPLTRSWNGRSLSRPACAADLGVPASG